MTRRLFYLALGATAGTLLVRRVARTAAALSPTGLRAGVHGVRAAAGEFAATVRLHAAEREAELRAALGLDAPAGGREPGR